MISEASLFFTNSLELSNKLEMPSCLQDRCGREGGDFSHGNAGRCR